MFRLISKASFKGSPFATGKKAKGCFGSVRALHSTPRRYKYFETAMLNAVGLPGVHEVMDDNHNVCAVVRNGEVTAIRPGYSFKRKPPKRHDPVGDAFLLALSNL